MGAVPELMSNAFALLGADSDADSDSDEEAVFVAGQHQRALPMPSLSPIDRGGTSSD